MAPHATDSSIVGQGSNGTTEVNAGEAPLEPGVQKNLAERKKQYFPRPPKFDDKYKEREYLKGRLAAAFRIFGKCGFDEGVAGHITLRDPVQPDCFWYLHAKETDTTEHSELMSENTGSIRSAEHSP